MGHKPTAAAVLAFVSLAAGAAGQPAPPALLGSVFQDHAVLQRDRPITVWGTAGPGEQVSISVNGRQASVEANGSGRWTATLPAMGAGGPYTLEARAESGASQAISDILIGDVWLCSGQSNMELTVARSRNGEFAVMRSANDRMRLLTVPHVDRVEPTQDLPAGAAWQVAGPQTVRNFSAACYLFARELQQSVQVPMGLINASWGGSAAEAWVSETGLRAAGGFDERVDLLKLYVRDDNDANQRLGRMWEDWWRAHAAAGVEPWKPGPAGTGDWTTVPEPMRNWKTWGVPILANHDGMVWYRRAVRLTPLQAARAATLSLGGIDEVDETWVNGRVIRNTFGWGTERTYKIPAGVLRPGDNTIVVNVLSTWDAGGMTGPADKLAITFDDGSKVPLAGEWQYQVVPLSFGRPPRAPWESVAGLTTLYNGMIAPLGAFGLRGTVWYQGETNADAPAGYQAILTGLMSSWRGQFGADLPFLVVQLPGFGPVPTAPVESGWSEIRDAQRRAVAADAHAGLAVTIDLGEAGDIHPINKRDVGVRLARAARHVVYGEEIRPSGPAARSASLEPGRVVVTFDDVDGQLVTYSASQAIGFELCGADKGSCRYVSGTVDSNRVVIALGNNPVPARVRFCWGGSPVCNLSDRSGLPAGPFELAIR
jgi:sialate O-acetylesterase